MKPIYIILVFLFMLNCDGNTEEPFCGVADPATELIWLKEIIDIAETHQDVNYIGAIWAEEYIKKDVVFVEMMLGSGGLPGHWFNCDGTALSMIPGNTPMAARTRLIYKHY